MTFDRTIHAVGLYVLTHLLKEGDMELRIPGKGSVTNVAEADLVLPGGGGSAWFLGLIEADPAAPGFNQADVLSSPPPADNFYWTVDDVVSAVTAPEPGGAAALAAVAALAMLGALRRPRSRRPTAGP
jgi:hypothetical protein